MSIYKTLLTCFGVVFFFAVPVSAMKKIKRKQAQALSYIEEMDEEYARLKRLCARLKQKVRSLKSKNKALKSREKELDERESRLEENEKNWRKFLKGDELEMYHRIYQELYWEFKEKEQKFVRMHRAVTGRCNKHKKSAERLEKQAKINTIRRGRSYV